MRVVIADDNLLVRAGVAALLRDAGLDVAGEAASADELLPAVATHRPDVAIVDIRMPPTQTDEGLRAAREIRARHPDTAIVLLSEHVEDSVATRLLAERPEYFGYLLKQRVTDVDEFVGTIRRVARRLGARSARRLAAADGQSRRGPPGGAHPARARGAAADRRGAVQPGDRRRW